MEYVDDREKERGENGRIWQMDLYGSTQWMGSSGS
jgi:hypothetical protein